MSETDLPADSPIGKLASGTSVDPPAYFHRPTPSPQDQASRIPLPPNLEASPPVGGQNQERGIRHFDLFMVVVILALAFLAGSFPANNSDVWLHFATGKLLIEGKYHFGRDPFSFTTSGAYWVNPNWLYDLLSFSIYRVVGGPGLIVIKALIGVLLAGVLLRLSQKGRSLWIPALTTALSVLAMSPWLLLQPALLSYLFLALTLWFLERPKGSLQAAGPVAGLGSMQTFFVRFGPLLVLFAIWVNVDSWFVLGPATVALYCLGQELEKLVPISSRSIGGKEKLSEVESSGSASGPGTWFLGLAAVAGLAACLMNPHHFHAFALPTQLGLSAAAGALREDSSFRGLLISPFDSIYYRSSFGLTVAGLAYFPLVLLGILSFVLNLAGWRWRRALVWLGLFLLSAYQVRAIPFFAVAAGPIMALNFQEYGLSRRRTSSSWNPRAARRWTIVGRTVTVLGGLGLVISAWPGWLFLGPFEPRRWAIDPDPSLAGASARLAELRKEGKLTPDMAGFNFSPDAANYFTWFCPEEKGFLDSRLSVFSKSAAEDFAAVRQALIFEPGASTQKLDPASVPDWRAIFRKWHINHIVLYDNDTQALAAPLRKLFQAHEEWILLYQEGRASIFGWRDPDLPQKRDPFATMRLDLSAKAFRPAQEDLAPLQGPDRAPEERVWYHGFIKPYPKRSSDRDEAAVHLIHFEALRVETFNRNFLTYETNLAAATLGLAGVSAQLWSSALDVAWRLHLMGAALASSGSQKNDNTKPNPVEVIRQGVWQNYLMNQDDGPPALLYLAVRAARRAVLNNPDDASAYLGLGESYFRLGHNTRERVWSRSLPMLNRLRQVQAVTAYNQALVIKPNLIQVHKSLAILYEELNFLDLSLKHLKEHLHHVQAAGRQAGETPEQFSDRIAALENRVTPLDKHVQEMLNLFLADARPQLKVQDRAMIALKYGLAGKALEVLLDSNLAGFGPQGMQMELALLLITGQVQRVREGMSSDEEEAQRADLGTYEYQLLRAQLEAATGNYDRADKSVEEMITALGDIAHHRDVKLPLRRALAMTIGQTLLDGISAEGGPMRLIPEVPDRLASLNRVMLLATNLRREANLTLIRGFLALESGRVEDAETFCRQALITWKSQADVDSGAGLDFEGRVVAQQVLELMATGK